MKRARRLLSKRSRIHETPRARVESSLATRAMTRTPRKRGRRTRADVRSLSLVFTLCWAVRSLVSSRYSRGDVGDARNVKDVAANAAFEALKRMVDECDAFEYVGTPRARPRNETYENDDVDALVSLTDATFVLTTRSCKTSFRNARWVCVKGKVIDSCAPKRLRVLVEKHGYAASLSHAFIFMHALVQGFRHVTIVEDDVVFSTAARRDLIEELREVIRGPATRWSFVRLGYRPLFLERQHKYSSEKRRDGFLSCPDECACEKIGTRTCRMSASGCDVRSSHLYMANSIVFKRAIRFLLDASDERRIIDCFVLQRFRNQIYATDSVAAQEVLDFPVELQEGYAKLFTRLCVR